MVNTNLFKHYALTKPIFAILLLLLICFIFRILDIFVLRLDEPPVGEIILSKTLGLLCLFAYLYVIHSNVGKLGFHFTNLSRSIIIAMFSVVLGLIAIYGTQFVFLKYKNAAPYLSIQRYTLLSLLVSVILGNIINVLMEEGIFRGLMLMELSGSMGFWRANLLQALIFGLWHIVWPLKDFYMGKIDSIPSFAFMSIGVVFTTFLMGLTMGYLFYQTGNLWAPCIWHFIMNITQNILVIKNNNNVASEIIETSESAVKGISIILVLIITNICLKLMLTLEQH